MGCMKLSDVSEQGLVPQPACANRWCRTLVLSWGNIAHQEPLWQCLETFLIVMTVEGVATGIYHAEVRDAAQHPSVSRMASSTHTWSRESFSSPKCQ